MAKNKKFGKGNELYLPVISGTLSGSPVIVGMLVGHAITDRDAAGSASVEVGEGVYSDTVTATGNITIGEPIFITVSTYALSDSAGSGKELFGHAVSTSTGSGSKTIDVRVANFSVPTDTAA
jgi:predicted RecA/RadA family phage recombinase